MDKMSETNEDLNDVDNLKPKAAIMDVLLAKFELLPDYDKKLFTYGPFYIGLNGAFSGLIANSFFRRVLNIRHGWFASSLPMAILPFISTVALHQVVVAQPLLSGNLDCKGCAEVRGALLGVVVGGLYPIALALPVNAGLAARYNTTPMPEKGNVLRFMVQITKPVLKKMSFVILLQAICGCYLTALQYKIYRKLVEMPSSNSQY